MDTNRRLVLRSLSRFAPMLVALCFGVEVEARPPRGQSESVFIRELRYEGPGCRPGTVAVNLSEDRTQFTLIFSELTASVGPNVPWSEARKKCRVRLLMNVPMGWSYAIGAVDTRGFVSLDEGVRGSATTRFRLSPEERPHPFKTPFEGPLDQEYLVHAEAPPEALAWSRCGERRPGEIETLLELNNRNNPSGNGLLTTDSIDGALRQTFHLTWRTCSGRG